jgi:hypothetical protein
LRVGVLAMALAWKPISGLGGSRGGSSRGRSFW